MRDNSNIFMLVIIAGAAYLLYRSYQSQVVPQTVAPGGLPLNTPVNTPDQVAAYDAAVSGTYTPALQEAAQT